MESKAARLGARLEDLRLQESVRPFFHYQTLYHDPRGASQGLAVTPSPLASGSPDPLVWAHFQIDESGLVTLPAVSEQFPELTSDADLDAFCSILGELQNALVLGQEPGHTAGTTDEELLLTLTESEWEQILRADSVYASITGGRDQPSAPVAREGVGRVVIRVLPLHWHTLVLGSGPALAALREVHTPSGVLLQGFAVAPGASGPLAWKREPPPRVLPGTSGDGECRNLVGGRHRLASRSRSLAPRWVRQPNVVAPKFGDSG